MLDSTGLELGMSLDDSTELISALDSIKVELESWLDNVSELESSTLLMSINGLLELSLDGPSELESSIDALLESTLEEISEAEGGADDEDGAL